jgi:HSP20 family protein
VDEHGEHEHTSDTHVGQETEAGERERAPDAEGEPEVDAAGGGSEANDRPWSGWGSFAEIQDTVSGLVDSALKNVAPATGRFPRYDLIELPSEGYMILFDMPGLEKADVDVSASGSEVTVEGTRLRPTLPDGAEVQRSERIFGRFQRTVRVPGEVDMGGVRAKMTNGVLEVRLPRRQAVDAQKIRVD